MKRLKNKLLAMDQNTATYSSMYDGFLAVVDPVCPDAPAEKCFDPTYYYGEVGFRITGTHKLAQDMPTVTVMIPCEALGITDFCDSAADYCLRRFARYVDALNAELYNRSRPDFENGKYYLHRPGGEVLTRNTAYFALCPQKDYEYLSRDAVILIDDGKTRLPVMCLCIRLLVQLPHRKIRRTIQILCRDLPEAVETFVQKFNERGLRAALELKEKQKEIRAFLRQSEYCAFIANGSVLPRAKGSHLPLEDAIPFQSPPEDEIEICGVRGMGIRRGVTVITGGGYSGKSTVLDAISAGIYDHVPGDGRELCITDESAVTVCAEDGRSVRCVNISPFIKYLPSGDTEDFSTEHASGSTSQAANIMEAVDGGSRLLLIDEGKSATNFMIRDRMMKELIEKEPITPFTDRAEELAARGVSTVLVIGGSGEYLSVADRIYLMEDYRIFDASERGKQIFRTHAQKSPLPTKASWGQGRTVYADRFTSFPEGGSSERLEVSDMGFILIGDERIDVRGLHNVVSQSQIDAMGFMLRELCVTQREHVISLRESIDSLYERIAAEGLDTVYSSYFTTCRRFLELPRKIELLSAVNRMRHVRFERTR